MKTKEEMAEEYVKDWYLEPLTQARAKVDFLAGYDACEKALSEAGGEFESKDASAEFKRYEKGLFCVDSFNRGARYQHSVMSAQIGALKEQIKDLEAENARLKDRYESKFMGRP